MTEDDRVTEIATVIVIEIVTEVETWGGNRVGEGLSSRHELSTQSRDQLDPGGVP